jgi:hypothetical protein
VIVESTPLDWDGCDFAFGGIVHWRDSDSVLVGNAMPVSLVSGLVRTVGVGLGLGL